MKVSELKDKLPSELFEKLNRIETFLPAQEKAIEAGLLDNNQNLVICTPTASGKTLIAEIAMMKAIFENVGKAIYIAPLKALANEKYKQFKALYGDKIRIGLFMGDVEGHDDYISQCDLILVTSEKLDSEIRHSKSWLKDVKVVVIDEIHLLNDVGRGPTLEVIITLLRKTLKHIRIIGLSATIGNPEQLSSWLDAKLVLDKWRPIELKKGVYYDGKIEFFEKKKKD
jgi:helicase